MIRNIKSLTSICYTRHKFLGKTICVYLFVIVRGLTCWCKHTVQGWVMKTRNRLWGRVNLFHNQLQISPAHPIYVIKDQLLTSATLYITLVNSDIGIGEMLKINANDYFIVHLKSICNNIYKHLIVNVQCLQQIDPQ